MQHSPTRHYPAVGIAFGHFYAKGEVLLQLALEAFTYVAAGAVLAFLAEEGRVVDGEEHGHRRLVDADGRQRFGVLEVAKRVAYLEAFQADNRTDVARTHFLRLLSAHTREGVELLYLRLFHLSATMGNGDVHALLQRATMHAAHRYATCIVAVVETRDEHLRRAFEYLGSGDVLEDAVEQIGDVCCRLLPVLGHPALLCRAVDNGEVELILRCIEVAHEVEHHLIHLFGAAVGLIDFVDDDDRLQANLQGFLQHEARLRHRSFEGIDEQQAAVGHVQDALHLAAEVRVARRVDDVYLRVLVVDADVLREDGDASLALQLVVVEHEFARLLVLAEEITCQEHFIYESCLAVVNVCYDGYVPDALHIDV